MARALLFTALSLSLIGCGASAPATAISSQAAATRGAIATAAPATASTAGSAAWTVTSASKATVSVREQLVGVSLPNDAVLVAAGATGAFTLNADGSFSADSKITFDLNTLASDSSNRDGFVKQNTLATRQFPTATFVPTKATGLALPLAANADVTFTMAGRMTIRGVTRDVTFDVVAKRTDAQLAAKATATPTWKFADFGLRVPSVPLRVVSIVDEIRLVVDLVATAAAG